MIRVALLCLACGVASATEPPVDTSFLKQYAETRGFMLGRPAKPKFTPDGKFVLFLRSEPTKPRQKLFQYEIATQKTTELLSPETLLKGAEENLTPEEKARRERQRVSVGGFADYFLDDTGNRVLVMLSGRPYVFDRTSGKAKELNAGKGTIVDPKWSPDGKYVSYVRDYDVYAYDLAADKELAVTNGGTEEKTNGLAEFVAQEEMDRHTGYWWSPDSKGIAFAEADHAGVEVWYIADPLKPDAPPQKQYYPRPGKKNVSVRLGIRKLVGGDTVWVEWDRKQWEYLARVTWQKYGPLTVTLQSRDQHEADVFGIDVDSGAKKLLFSMRPWLKGHWIDLSLAEVHWTRYDTPLIANGDVAIRPAAIKFVEQIGVSGGVANFDPDRERVFFHGGESYRSTTFFCDADGRRGNSERRYLSPYRVGPGLQASRVVAAKSDCIALLTSGFEALPRIDIVQMHPRFTDQFENAERTLRRLVSIYLNPDRRAKVLGQRWIWNDLLRFVSIADWFDWPLHGRHGSLLGTLPSVALEPELKPNVSLVDANGFYAAVVRPRNFDPKKKYPVVVDVYGGPHHIHVQQAMRNWLVPQWLADQGFIVVAIDNRGTPGRGREWERAIYKAFGDVPIVDQVKGLHALCDKYPEMDRDRVGIVGWSFGGYNAANAVLRRPDVFKAAVAGAPVTDWTDYDTHYTERYLGLLPESKIAYDSASLIPRAKNLSRPLLLVHGTADDNVYYRHTLKLADALFRAGKEFETLPLPGVTHMYSADPVVMEKLWLRNVRFFQKHLGEPK